MDKLTASLLTKFMVINLSMLGRHGCELLCERVGDGGFIKAKAVDGTKCEKHSFDMCVNGICRVRNSGFLVACQISNV